MARKTSKPGRAARGGAAGRAVGGRGAAPQPQVIPVETAIDLAYRHWQAGQGQEAEILCREVLAVWPGQCDALHLLGLIAHGAGRIDLAIDLLTQAVAVPGAPAMYASNLAELCRRCGRLAEAERAGRRAVATDRTLDGAWSNLGIILQQAGKLADSARCLQRVLALAPDFAEGHNNLGNTLRLQNRFPEAAARYDAALVLNPHYPDACSNLGSLTAAAGRPDEGMALLRRAVDLAPHLGDAYINASALEGARGRWNEALDWLEALRDFAPHHPGLPTGRARALAQLGRTDEASAEARRALILHPADADAHLVLGHLPNAAAGPDGGRKTLRRAAALGGPAGDAARTALAETGERRSP
ncbi:tetratricopeptide repeat protein [Azospirillum thiophilum]|uniref:tetratricopeptide repeat protein n=1 Tax=Azospirillum thiophilum TaxID=528244 RepID=UPI0009E1C995|nr:tetratricopeptide repeat protein [Azospirillum thiophilum]